jgi:hypothetical protein
MLKARAKACLFFFSVIAIRVEPERSNDITHEAINSGIVGVARANDGLNDGLKLTPCTNISKNIRGFFK